MKIAVITGTRAEFGIWMPVLYALAATKKLKPTLIATGMHLQKQFGQTIKDVRATSPVPVVEVAMYKDGDTPAASLARGTANLAAAYRKLKPDLVMVLGDRLEILAAANAALACQIAIAHVHGGETAPGQWDEQIRHAVTKMAHVHFCATKNAGQRLLQMGEDPKTVRVVGAPALDNALAFDEMFHADGQPTSSMQPLLVLHPTSPNDAVEYERTKMLVRLLRGVFKIKRIPALGPNNDPGHAGILRAYRELRSELDLRPSVPQEYFWTGLADGRLLVGNSSSGIIEAATLGCAVINIGDRQKGRERSPNVIDVPWQAKAIRGALKRVQTDKAFQARVAKRENVYGDGRASDRIVKVLLKLAGKLPLPLTKSFHDIPG